MNDGRTNHRGLVRALTSDARFEIMTVDGLTMIRAARDYRRGERGRIPAPPSPDRGPEESIDHRWAPTHLGSLIDIPQPRPGRLPRRLLAPARAEIAEAIRAQAPVDERTFAKLIFRTAGSTPERDQAISSHGKRGWGTIQLTPDVRNCRPRIVRKTPTTWSVLNHAADLSRFQGWTP